MQLPFLQAAIRNIRTIQPQLCSYLWFFGVKAEPAEPGKVIQQHIPETSTNTPNPFPL